MNNFMPIYGLYPALALIYAKLPWRRSERSKSQVPKASAPEAAEGLINNILSSLN
jgi:hypothetical protein